MILGKQNLVLYVVMCYTIYKCFSLIFCSILLILYYSHYNVFPLEIPFD